VEIGDMDIPGFKLHPLKGRLKNRWSVSVNGSELVWFLL
jgi:proteic killer suppression protein